MSDEPLDQFTYRWMLLGCALEEMDTRLKSIEQLLRVQASIDAKAEARGEGSGPDEGKGKGVDVPETEYVSDGDYVDEPEDKDEE